MITYESIITNVKIFISCQTVYLKPPHWTSSWRQACVINAFLIFNVCVSADTEPTCHFCKRNSLPQYQATLPEGNVLNFCSSQCVTKFQVGTLLSFQNTRKMLRSIYKKIDAWLYKRQSASWPSDVFSIRKILMNESTISSDICCDSAGCCWK